MFEQHIIIIPNIPPVQHAKRNKIQEFGEISLFMLRIWGIFLLILNQNWYLFWKKIFWKLFYTVAVKLSTYAVFLGTKKRPTFPYANRVGSGQLFPISRELAEINHLKKKMKYSKISSVFLSKCSRKKTWYSAIFRVQKFTLVEQNWGPISP